MWVSWMSKTKLEECIHVEIYNGKRGGKDDLNQILGQKENKQICWFLCTYLNFISFLFFAWRYWSSWHTEYKFSVDFPLKSLICHVCTSQFFLCKSSTFHNTISRAAHIGKDSSIRSRQFYIAYIFKDWRRISTDLERVRSFGGKELIYVTSTLLHAMYWAHRKQGGKWASTGESLA